MRRRRSRPNRIVWLWCAAVASALVAAAPAAAAETTTFASTGTEQTYTVPAGITELTIVAIGGGAPGGGYNIPSYGASRQRHARGHTRPGAFCGGRGQRRRRVGDARGRRIQRWRERRGGQRSAAAVAVAVAVRRTFALSRGPRPAPCNRACSLRVEEGEGPGCLGGPTGRATEATPAALAAAAMRRVAAPEPRAAVGPEAQTVRAAPRGLPDPLGAEASAGERAAVAVAAGTTAAVAVVGRTTAPAAVAAAAPAFWGRGLRAARSPPTPLTCRG